MVTHVIILVSSSSHAIRAKQVLKGEGIKAKLIPTPRQLSSDCGTSVRISEKEWKKAKRVLEENNAPYQQIVPHVIPHC
jgi:uncharacterized SAM-binding protein YcdF (DUF218 family)